MKKTKIRATRKRNENVSLDDLASFEPLIRHIAIIKKGSFLSEAERESEAWNGAVRAYNSYVAGRGAKLSTWMCLKAKFAIEDAERKERVHAQRESCRDAVFFTRIATKKGAETEEPEPEDAKVAAKRRMVASALAALDERTRNILERVWYMNETQAEIAAELNISASWCSRLYRRGMAQLKTILSEMMERE